MAVIVKDAVKQYGKGESRIYALDHASLEIQTGDVCVILFLQGKCLKSWRRLIKSIRPPL